MQTASYGASDSLSMSVLEEYYCHWLPHHFFLSLATLFRLLKQSPGGHTALAFTVHEPQTGNTEHGRTQKLILFGLHNLSLLLSFSCRNFNH